MSGAANNDVEDIEACAHEGRRPRDNGPYRIQIGDALFRFKSVSAPDPVFTGHALLDLAAIQPAHHHALFAVLTDGLLEEIRLEEEVDVRKGVEKFLAFKNDRLFRFLLNGREYQWGGAFISGAILLHLAKVDSDWHGVWLAPEDGEERPIRASELVDLGEPGVEIFVTRPLAATTG